MTIGEFALVGAGSVLTRDVAPRTIVFDTTARHYGQVLFCAPRLSNVRILKDRACASSSLAGSSERSWTRYLDRDPRTLRFCSNPYGKPSLARECGGDASLSFNVTHAGVIAPYAVTRSRAIGMQLAQHPVGGGTYNEECSVFRILRLRDFVYNRES